MNPLIPPSQKRNLLWNMIEPGDPYDIKKSLIARVPGDTRIFMGDHLELVCLFQAAEIERLHDSLREYAVRFKELERVELDRHSYETQIKELMELSAEGRGNKEEIMKLREFIRKQGEEMDDVKKKSANQDETLEGKYQEALRKVENFYNENHGLKLEIQNLENRLLAMRSTHQKELEELRGVLESDRRIQLERQINEISNGFKNERNHLEQEIRRLKDIIDSESQVNDQLRAEIHSLNQTISEHQLRHQKSMQVESKLAVYEQKLMSLSTELTRIQHLLNEKSRDNNDSKFSLEKKENENKRLMGRIAQLEDEVAELGEQCRGLERRVQELGYKQAQLLEYEEKLVMVTQEVERLRHLNQSKEAENEEYSRKLKQFELEMGNIKRQYRDLESSLRESEFERERLRGEINSSSQHQSMRIRELEEKVSSGLMENESVRRELDAYSIECDGKLRNLIAEIERLNGVIKVKIEELKLKDAELDLCRSTLREYQLQIQTLVSQGEEEIGRLERENESLRSQISQYKGQREKNYAEWRATTSELESENEGLRRKVRENQNVYAKTSELERTIYGLKGEIESMNQRQKYRNDQNSNLRLQISDVRQVNSRLSEQIEGTRRELTNSVNINVENTQLRNNKMILSKEIQRVNANLASKIQELKQARQIIERSKLNLEDNISKQQTWKRTEIQLKQNIGLYEQQISSMNLDFEKNRKVIQELENQVGQWRRDYENQEYSYGQEKTRLLDELKSRDRDILDLQQRYNVDMTNNNEKILKDSNHKINSLENEVFTLKDNLARKSNELIRVEADGREKDLLITKLKNEVSGLNIKLTELTRVKAAYEESMDSITNLTQENQRIKDRIIGQGPNQEKLQNCEERIILLSVEVDRLNKSIKEKDAELGKLRRSDGENAEKLNRIAGDHEQQLRLLETRIRGEYNESLRRAETLEDELRNYISSSNTYASQLSQKQNDVIRLKKLYEQLTLKLNEEVTFGSQSKDNIIKLSKEIDRLNTVLQRKVDQYNQLRGLYNNLIQSQSHRDQENTTKIYDYIGEIQRLNSILEVKVNELNDLSARYGVLEEKYQIEVENGETDANKRQIMATEIERLNTTIQILKEKSSNTSSDLIEEIERLNNALRLKVMESQEWQEQVNRSGEQLNKQYSELQGMYQQALRDIDGYKLKLSQFQDKFERIRGNFDNLNNIIETLKRENSQLKTQNYNIKVQISQYQTLAEMNKKLSQQIDRLNELKQDLEQEIADMRMRYVDQSALQKRLNEYLTLFVVLFAEIESLRIRVKDKEKEVEEVRRTSLAPFKIS